MATTKDILLATATTISTVGLAVSMALHFTPWPHGNQDNQTSTLNLLYKLEELQNVGSNTTIAYWDKKEKPKYVRVAANGDNDGNTARVYPLMVEDREWKKHYLAFYNEYAENTVKAYFTDGQGNLHEFKIKLTAYPDTEYR